MPQKQSNKHRTAERHQEKPMSSKRSLLIVTLIFVAVFISLAWNWAQDNVFDTAGAAVEKHAQNAASIMERARYGESANDIAYSVVGQSEGAKIDALRAAGTTERGEIVLRITIDTQNAPLFSKRYAQKCYGYEFPFSTAQGLVAKNVACPPGEPLSLSAPVKQDYIPARDLP